MLRPIRILSLLSLILAFSVPGRARPTLADFSSGQAAPAQERLVVFEGFLRDT